MDFWTLVHWLQRSMSINEADLMWSASFTDKKVLPRKKRKVVWNVTPENNGVCGYDLKKAIHVEWQENINDPVWFLIEWR